jgi:hypothetical protein
MLDAGGRDRLDAGRRDRLPAIDVGEQRVLQAVASGACGGDVGYRYAALMARRVGSSVGVSLPTTTDPISVHALV